MSSQPVARAEWPRCRCGVDLTLTAEGRVWQPRRDKAPDPTAVGPVHSVSILGLNPLVMRSVRTVSGWVRCGARVPLELVPWYAVGRCDAGYGHLVVDTASVPR